MPMPTDPVTNERLESVLLGIATQISSAVEGAKSEISGLVNEAELRWQKQLSDFAEAQTGTRASEAAPQTALRSYARNSRRARHARPSYCALRTLSLHSSRRDWANWKGTHDAPQQRRPSSSCNELRSCLTR